MNWFTGSAIGLAMLAGLSGAANAQSAGLAVVIANSYEGFLPGPSRDAVAIADKLEASGFSTQRILDVAGKDFAPRLDEIKKAAEAAGPLRIVYATGFGMCLNDDLMLFAEDMQPEQYSSGKVGDVVVPLSVVAEAVATGGSKTLIVFDTTPNQCTEDSLKALKLPENAALLVTTAVGGDVVDEIADGGHGAFTTAFLQQFAPDAVPKEMVEKIIEQVRTITEEQQVPVLIGDL